MRHFSFILIILVFSNFQSFACDCSERSDTKEDFESEWKRSDYVIEIRIIDSSASENDKANFGVRILSAEMLKKHKGKIESKTILVESSSYGGGMCYYPFEPEKSYLFYGVRHKETGVFKTSICDRTCELNKKKFDLVLLGSK